jgi:PAS domain S-box-containing protein
MNRNESEPTPASPAPVISAGSSKVGGGSARGPVRQPSRKHVPRVLLIEDNRGDARLIEALLEESGTSFDVEWMSKLGDGLDRLRADGPPIDAVLLDLALPDSRGFGTFAAVNQSFPSVPIVLLTGLDDEELAVRAVRQGAQDYLSKGRIDGPLLARAIHYAIERHLAEQALRRSEETLRLAMEASESGVWDLDVQSGTVRANAGCQVVRGFAAEEITDSLDRFWTSALHPDDRESAVKMLNNTLEARSPFFEMDYRMSARDGWVWLHAKGRVVEYDGSGEPLRFIMTGTNITARKHAEESALEQRRIATVLQENFVHPLPVIKGVDFGVVAQTAFEPELVGGDFSDVFMLNATSACVLLGDVAGKGIRAAGLTETVRSTVRALAMIDSSPAFILRKTNDLLLQRDTPWDYCTAVLLVLDTVAGDTVYSCAGHPAPVHMTANACRHLAALGAHPLGAFSTDYINGHITLGHGDYLVLYSDGVTEARRGGEQFGEERLLQTVAELRGRSARDLATGVRDAAAAFAGKLTDDLEVLALRRE